jgi:hypothetical protein
MTALALPPEIKIIEEVLAFILLCLSTVWLQRRRVVSLADALGGTAFHAAGAWNINGVWDALHYVCLYYPGTEYEHPFIEVAFDAHSPGSFVLGRNTFLGPDSLPTVLGTSPGSEPATRSSTTRSLYRPRTFPSR